MYRLSEFYKVPCERLLRLKEDLFKPNLKITKFFANIIGYSASAIPVIRIIALIFALIAAFCFFIDTAKNQKDSDKLSGEMYNIRKELQEN